jgi:hypothetical protein
MTANGEIVSKEITKMQRLKRTAGCPVFIKTIDEALTNLYKLRWSLIRLKGYY